MLGLGLGLSFHRAKRAGIITPAGVTNLARGVYVGPARSSNKLWQDSGKTTNATVDTDPVYHHDDPYGIVPTSSAVDNAHRMLLESDSGIYTIRGDSPDKRNLRYTELTPAGSFEVFAAVKVGELSNYLFAAGHFAGIYGCGLGLFYDNSFFITDFNTAFIAQTPASFIGLGSQVWHFKHSGSVNQISINGGSYTTMTNGAGIQTGGFITNCVNGAFVDSVNGTNNSIAGISIVNGTTSAAVAAGHIKFMKSLLGI